MWVNRIGHRPHAIYRNRCNHTAISPTEPIGRNRCGQTKSISPTQSTATTCGWLDRSPSWYPIGINQYITNLSLRAKSIAFATLQVPQCGNVIETITSSATKQNSATFAPIFMTIPRVGNMIHCVRLLTATTKDYDCSISSIVNCHWGKVGETIVSPRLNTVSVYAPSAIANTVTRPAYII